VVVFSTAIDLNNPELLEAKKRGLKLCHRSQLLAEFLKAKKALLVAGTHGKTTTSALLAYVLKKTGFSSSYSIGGILGKQGKNAGWGGGDYFVAEADESDGSFLNYGGLGAIVTNVEADHLDYWGSLEELHGGFRRFLDGISLKQNLFWCCEDPFLRKLKPPGISYGLQKAAELRAREIKSGGGYVSYRIEWAGRSFERVRVRLMGEHNVLNSLAVFGLALSLGVEEKALRRALQSFPGVKRRLEKMGHKGETLFFEDYGHHPTEIRAVLKTIKKAWPKRPLVCVFQPHRYTRTKALFKEFQEAFGQADRLIITDIYAAAEKPLAGVDSCKLAEALKARQAGVFYVPRPRLKPFLISRLQKEKTRAIYLFLGAGDIPQDGRAVLKAVKKF
jgi:UDP-N-acetylmuramate--alanine ligase